MKVFVENSVKYVPNQLPLLIDLLKSFFRNKQSVISNVELKLIKSSKSQFYSKSN